MSLAQKFLDELPGLADRVGRHIEPVDVEGLQTDLTKIGFEDIIHLDEGVRKMSQQEKMMLAILSGTQDKNISFSDLQSVLDRLGFQCRIKGDHFIYTMDGIEEIINIQPIGKMAKPYQVKQVRQIIQEYQLGGTIHEV